VNIRKTVIIGAAALALAAVGTTAGAAVALGRAMMREGIKHDPGYFPDERARIPSRRRSISRLLSTDQKNRCTAVAPGQTTRPVH
jgi:hypothetical protein